MSWLGDALSSVSKAVGVTPTTSYGGSGYYGSDQYRKDMANAASIKANSSTPSVKTPAYSGPSAGYQIDAGTQAQIDALNKQTAAIQAQVAAAPKLIYRDTNAAWQNAQNRAASSVNPVYSDNLNRKLKEMADLRAQQQASTEAAKTAADTTLTQTNEDIGVNRQRTVEDTASAIAQNMLNEGNWQTQEGQQANAQEEAARLALGDQGIQGRGAGQLQESQIQRNQSSDQQTQSFKNERDTKQMLQTRTFQDLDTKGTRATQFNKTQKADLERTLNDFITNQGNAEQDFRASNEAARLSALFDATQQTYKTDTASWLASLMGSGARSQDILASAQLYGG